MRTPEGALKDKVKVFLKERGAYFFMPVQTGYGVSSLDFIGCYKGRFFAIETKGPGKIPTPRQQATMREMAAAQGYAIASDDWDTLKLKLTMFFAAVDGRAPI